MERSKLPLIISNTSIEEIRALTNDNVFNPFFSPGTKVFPWGRSELTHQDIAARCTFSLPLLSLHTAARSPPHPGRSSFASPSRRHRTWSIRSNDPTDSTDHWLKEIRQGQWQSSSAHCFRDSKI